MMYKVIRDCKSRLKQLEDSEDLHSRLVKEYIKDYMLVMLPQTIGNPTRVLRSSLVRTPEHVPYLGEE